MPFFIKSVIEKIMVTKIPFLGFFLLVTLPVLFPETANWLFAFWIFYYILWGWVWSWLLASWMRFNFVATEQINLSIFSAVVGRTFLHQVKLYAVMLISALIVGVPVTFFLLQPLMGLASPEEMRTLQIGLSGRGEFAEPGLSFFMQCVFIMMVVPIFIGVIVYFRCGFGMLALLQGSEKVGLMASWRKSKGTTSLAVKSFIPLFVVMGLLMYVGSLILSLGILLNFIVQAVSTVVGVPMFCQALTRYYGQLQSNSEE